MQNVQGKSVEREISRAVFVCGVDEPHRVLSAGETRRYGNDGEDRLL